MTISETTSSARDSSVHTGLSADFPMTTGEKKVREVVNNELLVVVEFVLGADQLIHEEEPSPMPTVLHVLEGTIRFFIDGIEHDRTRWGAIPSDVPPRTGAARARSASIPAQRGRLGLRGSGH